MTATQPDINAVLDRLDKVKKQGNGYMACCPAHEDRNPSLSINQSDDGTVMLKCHAGCEFNAIVSALGMEPSDLFPAKEAYVPAAKKPRISKVYDYVDATGEMVFQSVRYEPKDFRGRQPNGSGGCHWHMRGVKRVLYHLPAVIEAAKDGGRVYVVEGEKDADSLVKLGLCATTVIGGAIQRPEQWHDQYTKALEGADVVIIADNDNPGKQHATILHGIIGGKVVMFEDVKDASDWIAAGGTAVELDKIADNAPAWKFAVPDEEDKRAETSADNGKKGGRKTIDYADLANRFVEEFATDFNGKTTLRWWHGSWCTFNGRGWDDISFREVESLVSTFLRACEDVHGGVSRNLIGSVISNMWAQDLCGLRYDVKKPSWLDTNESAENWIAFANGKAVNVLDLANGIDPDQCTRDVSPDFFSNNFVDYDFDLEGTCPKFHAYLERVLPDPEERQLACELLGLLVSDETRYEVFFQLYGNGENGKTVLLDVLTALVGQQNVSFVQLGELASRFQGFPLAESKLNVCGELQTDMGRGTYAAIEGQFKHAVSGGQIEVERKGADKYSAKCTARFVMSSNSLPSFVDKSNGIWRRLRILDFPVQITADERDASLADKIIKTELPGVLLWAIGGLGCILHQGGVLESKKSATMKEKHRASCDHEKTFLDESYEKGKSGNYVDAGNLYESYKNWMGENGYKCLGAGKFSARVESVFTGVFRTRKQIEEARTHVFENMRFS